MYMNCFVQACAFPVGVDRWVVASRSYCAVPQPRLRAPGPRQVLRRHCVLDFTPITISDLVLYLKSVQYLSSFWTIPHPLCVSYIRKALALSESLFGAAHPETGECLHALALNLCVLGVRPHILPRTLLSRSFPFLASSR